jgi:DNA-directed RNA polymerase specialized sigma24 family protein
MSEPGSVTVWLDRLKAGDRDAAVRKLWGVYFGRLVQLARRHLRGRPRVAIDEEDVALSAFDSFVRAAEGGRFPRLDDRDDLWQVLFVLTARKAADLAQADGRQKRGGGKVIQSLAAGDGSEAEVPIPAADPDPAEAAAMAEEGARLLCLLPDEQLRQIAVWKMEGYTNAEIAAKIDRSEPTVERKLMRIRELWQGETA